MNAFYFLSIALAGPSCLMLDTMGRYGPPCLTPGKTVINSELVLGGQPSLPHFFLKKICHVSCGCMLCTPCEFLVLLSETKRGCQVSWYWVANGWELHEYQVFSLNLWALSSASPFLPLLFPTPLDKVSYSLDRSWTSCIAEGVP